MADRRTRAGRISKVQRPAMMRSELRRFGAASGPDSESEFGVAVGGLGRSWTRYLERVHSRGSALRVRRWLSARLFFGRAFLRLLFSARRNNSDVVQHHVPFIDLRGFLFALGS